MILILSIKKIKINIIILMNSICVNGTVSLFFAGLISKIFGAVYRIPLSNFLGSEGIGLYQMAFPIYSFLLTIITGGISVTLSRRIASSRAVGNTDQIQKDYKMAKKLSLILGIMCFALLVILAYPLAYIQGNKNAIWGYLAISVGFIFASLLGAYRGYYQGYSNMTPSAVSGVLEQIFKLILGLILASSFSRFGAVYGVFGALIGISLSEILTFLYFLIINGKIQKQKVQISSFEFTSFFKQSMSVGASYGILPLSSLIDSFLIVNLLKFSGLSTTLSTSLYGIETGMILPIVNMPNILISALSVCSLPEISYNLKKDKNISELISSMIRVVYVFILPCMVGLFMLSRPILTLVYPNLSPELLSVAVNLLKFSVFEMFFLCFVTISNSILQAMSKPSIPIRSLILAIIIKTIFTLILVPNNFFGIYGLVIASILGYFASCVYNLIIIKKENSVRLTFMQTLSPIIACVFMALFIYLYIVGTAGKLNIISGILLIFLSAILYFLTLRLFNQYSFKELKKMLQKSIK